MGSCVVVQGKQWRGPVDPIFAVSRSWCDFSVNFSYCTTSWIFVGSWSFRTEEEPDFDISVRFEKARPRNYNGQSHRCGGR